MFDTSITFMLHSSRGLSVHLLLPAIHRLKQVLPQSSSRFAGFCQGDLLQAMCSVHTRGRILSHRNKYLEDFKQKRLQIRRQMFSPSRFRRSLEEVDFQES